MTVLIDTSLWVQHFRCSEPRLVALLTMDLALTHPLVIAELALGTPPAPRERTLRDLESLQECRVATVNEVRTFIEREKLWGLGCGYVDIALLASTLITSGATLWTLDKNLSALAQRFSVGYSG